MNASKCRLVVKQAAGLLAFAAAVPVHAQSQTPSNAELYQIIQSLQAEVKSLREQLAAEPADRVAAPKVDALQAQVEAQQAKIDALAEVAQGAEGGKPAVHFGGYGELHYNNLSADDPANDLEMIDFHRFVLYAGYDFSDRIRFVSELELEHSIAGDGQDGEIELEQAYIEFDASEALTARAGLMLIPAGIINETHEPTTFYGVERNDVESIIIPSTWWAGGVGTSYRFGQGLQWDVMVHEGLAIPTDGSSAFRVRSGRQKTSEARASDLAYTTRLRYTGLPGLELAGSLQWQTDASQVGGDGLDEALLYTAHAVWTHGAFGLRLLYAGWDLSGDAVEAADADTQTGWYVEPSYRIAEPLGIYARYEDVDAARAQDQFSQWEGGINYYPHPQVVLKADYRMREHDLSSESGRDFDGFDLGIGYNF
ncbi:MAG: porin [Nevskiales bacterium]|nr:porin [Nevskiales bacterium]